MTELEKIERAKMYLDKLANGINPLDDTPVPEAELINNVRLSRCFFFTADVLRQVIENGGVQQGTAGRKKKKLPLAVPFEKREQFAFSDTPITLSEIAGRVNALIDSESMQKLTYSGIITWLAELGMVERIEASNGKQTVRPTQSGRENGISVEERTGGGRTYQVVVYNTAAQHFIVDNLDAVAASENLRVELQGTPWTEEQDRSLVELYERSVPLSEIARTMQRKTPAVRSRLKKLGMEPRWAGE